MATCIQLPYLAKSRNPFASNPGIVRRPPPIWQSTATRQGVVETGQNSATIPRNGCSQSRELAPDSRGTRGSMVRLRFKLPLLLAACLGIPTLMWGQASGTSEPAPADKPESARKSHAKKSPKVEEPPLPPYIAAPLPPMPLEEMPAIPPQVEFQDGQLTIVSQNSTLADILREVRKETGAEFEVPSGASERVVTAIGPGPARDVLAKLLNGTHFNYVMVGSTADPTVLERVVLTPKPAPGAEVVAANGPAGRAVNPANRRLGVAPAVPQPTVADEDGGDTEVAADDSDDEPKPDQQPPQPAAAAAAAAAAPAEPTPTAAGSINTPQGPKTPEQLLQELQQRMQLRKQMQEQQNQGSQTGNQPVYPPQPPTTAPQD
jgi:hypothetical protein